MKFLSLMLLTSLTLASTSVRADHESKHLNKAERSEMRKEAKKAFAACREETGIKKPDFKNGEKLSKEDRKKFKTCLKSKGIKRHKRPMKWRKQRMEPKQ